MSVELTPEVTPTPTTTTPNYTVNDLVLTALKLMGVEEAGETSTAEDLNDGMMILNLLLDEMSLDRSKIYARTEDTITLTIGKGAYSFGQDPTADINSILPISIENAFLRDLDLTPNLDYPLSVDMIQEEYNAIPIKTITTIPTKLFFLKSWPLGYVYLNYLPMKAYELHLFSWKPISQGFSSLQDVIQLPDGWKATLVYNLAVSFASAFGRPVPPEVAARAVMLNSKLSAKNYEVPRVRLGGIPGTSRGTGSIFNPFVRG